MWKIDAAAARYRRQADSANITRFIIKNEFAVEAHR